MGNVIGTALKNPPNKPHKAAKTQMSSPCDDLLEVFEGLKDSILAVDRNWNVIYANRRIANVFGYKVVEMLGKNLWCLLPAIVGTEIEAHFRSAMSRNVAEDFELRGLYKTGYFELHIAPFSNGLAVCTRDIAERKKAELVLLQKTVAIDKAQNAILIADSSFRLVMWNKGAEDLFGYAAHEILGRPINFLPAFYVDISEVDVFQKVAARGRWDGVAVQKHKDGSELYVLETITQIWEESEIVGYTIVMRDITDLKRMELELSQSKQRMHDILESIDDDVYSLDRDWCFIYINHFAADDLGYEPSQLIGKNLWTVLPKLVGTELERNFRESMEKREVRRFEWDAIYAKGLRDVSVFPSAEGITVHAKNVTQRKNAEAALMQSEERFAKVFHSSPAAFFISRLEDGYIIDVNDAFLKTLGYRYEEVVRHTAFQLNIYPEPNTRNEFVRLLHEKHSLRDYELTMQTKTGQPLTLMASLDIIGLDGEDLLLGVFVDITERKKAEIALRQSENRLKMAQRIAHLGSWEFLVKENRALWSEELFHIFNLPPKPFGLSIEEYRAFIHPEDVPRVEEIAQQFIIGVHNVGDLSSFDYRILLADGSVRVLHTERVIDAVDAMGNPSKVIGIEQDITDRKLIELQLEQYSKHLEQLVEERTKQLKDAGRLAAIGATAGMVGHDIRNPLQAITNELFLTRQAIENAPDVPSKSEAIESVAFIQDQVNYINKIVSDLQDYARPLKPTLSEVTLEKLIAGSFSSLSVPDNVEARTRFDEVLPKIKTDPWMLKRIIVNLATNALQAMPNGGTLTIHAAYNRQANRVALTVEDTGVGMSTEVQKKLFTPLFTTKSKGQGFGLAVVKRLTEVLGGSISFESQEGKGTKFTVELPT
jgi:PAS domain S-box-containing protein